eukprot:TRINITY_DN115415_c0_g1_i1.p1 TRINITY_DN115415_c0_g1~~TRINITY_DN115415_c0_g1_i1.p1  ORF type:complete len:307 (+),score=42.11 TRINITY_DN115415_c0_g1_i1:82-1002(+)
MPRPALINAAGAARRPRCARRLVSLFAGAYVLAVLGHAAQVIGFVPAWREAATPPATVTDDLSQAQLGGALGTAAWLAPASSSLAASDGMSIAPSGVSGLPEGEQAAVVLLIFALLAIGTFVFLALLRGLRSALPDGWFDNWAKTWPIIGAVYCVAGSAHFTAADAFGAIYPPAGTWGFWYLPGSADFHVAWTGVAELAGGIGLFVGALLLGIADLAGQELPGKATVQQLNAYAALGLFVLTIVVSPANIYMYTHGAQMIGLTPGDAAIPVEGHYIRALLQCVLLAILWAYWEKTSAQPQGQQTAS